MRTFSVYPEKRTSRLPVIEYAPFKEPLCRSLVTERTRNIMVRGWVWWREPFPKVLSQLIPYKDVSGWSVSTDQVKE